MNTDRFTFASFAYDVATGVAEFTYAYNPELHFTERLTLASPRRAVSDQMLLALHLALGMSYWKAYCPQEIVVNSGTLTRKQADFWNTLYTKGLGEFFYVNKIDFRGLVNFPFDENAAVTAEAIATSGALVPIGGGKDSLVSIEMLEKAGEQYSTFTLGEYDVIEKQRTHIDAPHLTIQRSIDPKLFELNTTGAYNGHIPISSIYAFTAIFQAIQSGKRYVILSNERSANIGNVEYLGAHINHQWSKSVEFEKMVNAYVKEYITPDIEYFSLLRPLYEIAIAREFAQHQEWLPRFTSCNRNFAIQKESAPQGLWCGECAKCAFVFAILAPFVPREKLVGAFGKNLFADEMLLPLYKQLYGVEDIKPFDCVGTPEEVTVAFAIAHEKGEYKNDAIMQFFVQEILPTADVEVLKTEVFSVSDDHCIPKPFHSLFL